MSKKAFVVTGLQFGDEGKGHTAHWLCAKHKAHTVIRTGGPQAFHRVVTSTGQEHGHAQFGSGTLLGAGTHLSKNMVVDPYAVITEGKALIDLGVSDVFKKMTVHEDALVITPFQAIANRLRELVRQGSRHGSVGIGVGETVLDAEVIGEMAIRAGDLNEPYLRDKLESIQKYKINELGDLFEQVGSLSGEAKKRARLEIANLRSEQTIQWAVGWFKEAAFLVEIVSTDYVSEEILGRDGAVVLEGSQGVLLDRFYGFHPYTTKIRTIPETSRSLLKECEYNGEVQSLGVMRAYQTRHGAGPFVTESLELTKKLPDVGNGEHLWQGNFRVGCLDLVSIKYAIEACGGKQGLDGLVVTCLDRINLLGEWPVCRAYKSLDETEESNFFQKNSEGLFEKINVFCPNGTGYLKHKRQKKLGGLLAKCVPSITIFKVRDDAVNLCANILDEELNIPVTAVSVGETENDCLEFASIKKGQTV